MKHLFAFIVATCAYLSPFASFAQDSNASLEDIQISSEGNDIESNESIDSEGNANTASDIGFNPSEVNSEVQNGIISSESDPILSSDFTEAATEVSIEDTLESSAQLTSEEEAELALGLQEDSNTSAESSTNTHPIASFIQSLNPDIAFIADFALAWFSDKDKNYQQGAHDPAKTGFNLQQLEMSVSASVDHLFRFDSNLVFSVGGVEIEEAYATTTALPCGLQLRAGQFLSRVGRINATHPHTWDFIDQVFMISKFYGLEGNRGLGIELSWLPQHPWYAEIAAAAQMPGSSASNRSFMDSESDIDGVQDLLYTFAVKQYFAFNDETGLLWGLSVQTAPNNTGRENRTEIYGTDITLKWTSLEHPEMALTFQTEAMFRVRQVPGDLLFDAAGYSHLVWQINREWATGIRGEYGSGLENDPLDPDWTTHRGRLAVQGTWSPSHFARIRAQGSVDFVTWQSPIYALLLALEVNVGTHPAHSF